MSHELAPPTEKCPCGETYEWCVGGMRCPQENEEGHERFEADPYLEDNSEEEDGLEEGEWATGPTNDNFGYDPDLVAPLDEVREAAELTGDEMWSALEACSWVEASSVSGPVYDTYSDGEWLRIGEES